MIIFYDSYQQAFYYLLLFSLKFQNFKSLFLLHFLLLTTLFGLDHPYHNYAYCLSHFLISERQ